MTLPEKYAKNATFNATFPDPISCRMVSFDGAATRPMSPPSERTSSCGGLSAMTRSTSLVQRWIQMDTPKYQWGQRCLKWLWLWPSKDLKFWISWYSFLSQGQSKTFSCYTARAGHSEHIWNFGPSCAEVTEILGRKSTPSPFLDSKSHNLDIKFVVVVTGTPLHTAAHYGRTSQCLGNLPIAGTLETASNFHQVRRKVSAKWVFMALHTPKSGKGNHDTGLRKKYNYWIW